MVGNYWDAAVWYTPGVVRDGGAITSNWGVNNGQVQPATYLWVLQGGGTKGFWMFDLSGKRWIVLPDIPEPVSSGGSLTHGFDGRFYWIYAIVGGERYYPNFYKYGPVAGYNDPNHIIPQKWYGPFNLPREVRALSGASLAYQNETLYYNPAGGVSGAHYKVWTPNIPLDPDPINPIPWEMGPNFPDYIGRGSGMAPSRNAGGYMNALYVLRGDSTLKVFYRDNFTPNWRGFTSFDPCNNVRMGGAIAIGRDSIAYFFVYAFIGKSHNFWRHHPQGFEEEEPDGGMVSGLTSNTSQVNLLVHPNPFTSHAQIRYSLPKKTFVKLTVYNNSGQAIRSLFSGFALGNNSLFWDKKDAKGKTVLPGVYFLQLKTDESQTVVKVIVNR